MQNPEVLQVSMTPLPTESWGLGVWELRIPQHPTVF